MYLRKSGVTTPKSWQMHTKESKNEVTPMPVMSIRLSEQELKRLKTLAKEEEKENSSVARELLMDGLKYKMLLAYKEGKVSLAKLSKTLGISLSEAIDLLALFGLQSPISYDDYLQGVETARKAIR